MTSDQRSMPGSSDLETLEKFFLNFCYTFPPEAPIKVAGLSAPRFFTELIVCRGSGMIYINQVLVHFINFSKTKLGLCFIFCGGGGEKR